MYISFPVRSVVLRKGVNEVQTGHTIQRLLLHYPAAGIRQEQLGTLSSQASNGSYASIRGVSSYVVLLFFMGSADCRPSVSTIPLTRGSSVRCVSVF